MLREAIDSVLAQTVSDIQLIVVDDGSTDQTPEILKAYGSALEIVTQPNRGVSAARNRGIAYSRGLYIALLDSDDLWLPAKIQTQLEFFASHPNAWICQTDEIWIRNGVRVNPGKRHRKPSGMIFEPSLALCLVSPSAVMMRREMFPVVGLFREDFPACEDYDMWLRISRQYPVHLIPDRLVVKRGGHADQLSRLPLLDSYRIQSIYDIMKSRIHAAGCRKRGRVDEAGRYENMAAEMQSSPPPEPCFGSSGE
jgi:glycosyltransferase involved in cell wall biosynthesis